MLFLLIVIILVVGVACVVLANWIYDRQKAEIESLNNALDEQCDACSCVLLDERDNARAEAIKEFAERLKERAYTSSDWSHGEHPQVVECDDIDDIVEEMTEGK